MIIRNQKKKKKNEYIHYIHADILAHSFKLIRSHTLTQTATRSHKDAHTYIISMLHITNKDRKTRHDITLTQYRNATMNINIIMMESYIYKMKKKEKHT